MWKAGSAGPLMADDQNNSIAGEGHRPGNILRHYPAPVSLPRPCGARWILKSVTRFFYCNSKGGSYCKLVDCGSISFLDSFFSNFAYGMMAYTATEVNTP